MAKNVHRFVMQISIVNTEMLKHDLHQTASYHITIYLLFLKVCSKKNQEKQNVEDSFNRILSF